MKNRWRRRRCVVHPTTHPPTKEKETGQRRDRRTMMIAKSPLFCLFLFLSFLLRSSSCCEEGKGKGKDVARWPYLLYCTTKLYRVNPLKRRRNERESLREQSCRFRRRAELPDNDNDALVVYNTIPGAGSGTVLRPESSPVLVTPPSLPVSNRIHCDSIPIPKVVVRTLSTTARLLSTFLFFLHPFFVLIRFSTKNTKLTICI